MHVKVNGTRLWFDVDGRTSLWFDGGSAGSSCSLSKRLSEQANIGRHGAGIWLNQALCPTAFLRVGQSRNARSRRS